MVPVTIGLEALREALARRIQNSGHQPEHAKAFVSWLLEESGSSPSDIGLTELAARAEATAGAERQAMHAAVLGYASHAHKKFQATFIDHLGWLRKRSFFVPGRPPGFEIDGIALLGIALGISALPDDRSEAANWLGSILRQQPPTEMEPDWNDALVAAARKVFHLPGEVKAADLEAALCWRLGWICPPNGRDAAWKVVSDPRRWTDGITRAATQLGALTFIVANSVTINPAAVTLEQIEALLGRIVDGLRFWTWEHEPRTRNSVAARWEIDNEYHVQNLLWALLAPIFPDLKEEEWLTSLGQHKPRADFAVPSLNLLIEAKFLRAGKSAFAQVIKEVAADASTYLQDASPYRHLIAVIWDDLARTEEHGELRKALLAIRGVTAAIIIPRPQRMVRTP